MPTWRLLVEYDGTAFSGWQVQPHCRTVQGELRDALATVLQREITPVGAGRTDAGVHAVGQVASLRTEERLDPDRVRRSLNGLTGDDVVVRALDEVADAFHARFSARRRAYRYRLLDEPSALYRDLAWCPRRRPRVEPMVAAAHHLRVRGSFASFAASEDDSPSKVCAVERAVWGEWSRGLELHVEADRFLHHMVRVMVGTLVEVGLGKRDPDDLPALLAAEDRRQAGPTAPALGLTLMRVDYPEELLHPDVAG